MALFTDCGSRSWLALVALTAALTLNLSYAGELDRTVLPILPQPFTGTLAPTEADSTPQIIPSIKAPEGAPNVILVMTDDVGFGAAGTFGGPVPTPNLDKLAAKGLRYNQFHTTGICSPTRAALLTGRNHHSVGNGMLADLASPYPGYTARIPDSAATIAKILKENGYNTAMFGKEHNVPSAHRSPAGPFDQWPTGRGFETFYGFVAGDTNQWEPVLFDAISAIDKNQRPENYLLDKDLIDRAITWVHNQKAAAPDKPFFIYYAPGSAHAPLQAPKDWIARFKGKFDHGWDDERQRILARQKSLGVVPQNTQLAPRPEQIPTWDSLSGTEQRVYARYMEIFAAMLAYQDAQFGRLVNELERMGIADNTLVLFIQGDNGSSGEGGHHGTLNELAHLSAPEGEMPVDIRWLADNLDVLGGPDTYLGYPVGWAFATGAPFPWVKQIASHLGGVRNGLVVSWPERIKAGGQLRSQYHHVIDILPTILDAAQLPAPKVVNGVPQLPVEGKSMLYSFNNAQAESVRTTQYYEILGNRGIYHDGWLANTTPRNMPWHIAQSREGSDVTTYEWELYDLRNDFSQSTNLADRHPDKLAEMKALFDREARKYQVYPLHDTGAMARAMKLMRTPGSEFELITEKTLWGPNISLSLFSAPQIFQFPFTIEAEITVPEGGANGVILAAGSQFGGWSFYLDDGVPVAVAAVSPLPGGSSRVAASAALEPGQHRLRFEFDTDDLGGDLEIEVDGKRVAKGEILRRPKMMAGGGETIDTGRDTNDAVSTDYRNGGVFTGQLQRVDIKVNLPLWQRAAIKLMQ